MNSLHRKALVGLLLGIVTVGSVNQLRADDTGAKSQLTTALIKDLQSRDYSAAKQKFLRLIELTPDKDEKNKLQLQLAGLDVDLGNPSQAIAQITQVLSQADISKEVKSEAHISLGNAYRGQKDYTKAKEEYLEASTVKGIPPQQQYGARFKIFLMLSTNKNFEEARKELSEAREIKDLPAWTMKSADKFIASSYVREGQYKKAREELSKVADIDFKSLPKDDVPVYFSIYESARLDIARSYFLEKQYAAARSEYEKILRIKEISSETKDEIQVQLQAIDEAEKK